MASCTESSEEESEVRLLPPKEKPKSDTDLTKCIICQEKSSERLRSPTEAGLRSFKEAVEVRKDETYHRISFTFENLEAPDVVWHYMCFQSYTFQAREILALLNHYLLLKVKKGTLTDQVRDRKLMQWIGPFVYFASRKSQRGQQNL